MLIKLIRNPGGYKIFKYKNVKILQISSTVGSATLVAAKFNFVQEIFLYQISPVKKLSY